MLPHAAFKNTQQTSHSNRDSWDSTKGLARHVNTNDSRSYCVAAKKTT